MRRKEVPRAGLLKAAVAGKITNPEGARAMHVSLRQFCRVKGRFAAAGVDGLLHRLRGRLSPRRLTPEVCARAAQKSRTQARRIRYNRAAAMQGTRGELTGDLSVPRSRTGSQRC